MIRVALAATLTPGIVGVGWYIQSRPPTPGTVRVYDSATGRKLWSRTTDGGYVVVFAVTPGAALVADADDCIHGGTGTVEILTPTKTVPVASASGCAIFHFRNIDGGVYARRVGGTNGRLLVTLETYFAGHTISLPCPCPMSPLSPNGTDGSPVNRGAYARVQRGAFVAGSD